MSLTIRMHLWVICSIGSIPSTLPAATAFSLRSTNLSLWNIFWQNLQYQSPRGTPDRDAQSAWGKQFNRKFISGRYSCWNISERETNKHCHHDYPPKKIKWTNLQNTLVGNKMKKNICEVVSKTFILAIQLKELQTKHLPCPPSLSKLSLASINHLS